MLNWTSCIFRMQLWQEVAVWKIRKFPISVETHLSATAVRVKYMLCESAFNAHTKELLQTTVFFRDKDILISLQNYSGAISSHNISL